MVRRHLRPEVSLLASGTESQGALLAVFDGLIFLTAFAHNVQTLKTGRMQAWQGLHWITQRLSAHTALRQWTLHFRMKGSRKRLETDRYYFSVFFSFSSWFFLLPQFLSQRKKDVIK